MTTTTKTTTKPVTKSATKSASKATVKPVTKAAVKTIHAITPAIMMALGAAFASIMNTAFRHHGGRGRIAITTDGYALTPDGVKYFSGRSETDYLEEARTLSAKGGKTRDGHAYVKAGDSAPFPFRYPWDGTKGETGRKDSQAAFDAIMLKVMGK